MRPSPAPPAAPQEPTTARKAPSSAPKTPVANEAGSRAAHSAKSHKGQPSFAEIVYAHFDWWKATRNGGGAGATETAYHDAMRRFEHGHGRIVTSYWCSDLESGVALTELKRRFPLRSIFRFHRETDWATRQFPEIANELHRCDELAIRAQSVLTGVRQRICLHFVAATASHLLSLVDGPTAYASSEDREAAIKLERQAVDRAEAYYRQAANGQAQIVYFVGMLTVALVVAVTAGLFLTVEWKVGVGALVAGAVGAVVSVVQRINAGDFKVNYDFGRLYAFFLGGLRPLIGGAFAVVIAFAFSSGILHLPITSTNDEDQRLALLVVSFLAGFSERWAQDTLATALPQSGASASLPPEGRPADAQT
jgi:hypothetical protein